jgi:hypothetical protein
MRTFILLLLSLLGLASGAGMELCVAARSGNLDQLKEVLAKGEVDVNAKVGDF